MLTSNVIIDVMSFTPVKKSGYWWLAWSVSNENLTAQLQHKELNYWFLSSPVCLKEIWLEFRENNGSAC